MPPRGGIKTIIDGIEHYTCNTCGKTLPVSAYNVSASRSRCAKCTNERNARVKRERSKEAIIKQKSSNMDFKLLTGKHQTGVKPKCCFVDMLTCRCGELMHNDFIMAKKIIAHECKSCGNTIIIEI